MKKEKLLEKIEDILDMFEDLTIDQQADNIYQFIAASKNFSENKAGEEAKFIHGLGTFTLDGEIILPF